MIQSDEKWLAKSNFVIKVTKELKKAQWVSWDNWIGMATSLAQVLHASKLFEQAGYERANNWVTASLQQDPAEFEESALDLDDFDLKLRELLGGKDFFDQSPPNLFLLIRAFKGYVALRKDQGATDRTFPKFTTLGEFTQVKYARIPKLHSVLQILKVANDISKVQGVEFMLRLIHCDTGGERKISADVKDYLKKLGGRRGLTSEPKPTESNETTQRADKTAEKHSFLYELAQNPGLLGALASPVLIIVNPSLGTFTTSWRNSEGNALGQVNFLDDKDLSRHRYSGDTVTREMPITLFEDSSSSLKRCLLVFRGDSFWAKPPLYASHSRKTIFRKKLEAKENQTNYYNNYPQITYSTPKVHRSSDFHLYNSFAEQLVFSNSLIIAGACFLDWESYEVPQGSNFFSNLEHLECPDAICHIKLVVFQTTINQLDYVVDCLKFSAATNPDCYEGALVVCAKNSEGGFVFKIAKEWVNFNFPIYSEAVYSFLIRSSNAYQSNWAEHRHRKEDKQGKS